MAKILMLSNHHLYTYKFRKEIIQGFLDNGDEVHLVLPYGKYVEELKKMGCQYTNVELDRRGTNIFKELKLVFSYYKIIKKERPDYLISYTIKPNIYGGILSRILSVKNIPNITGLGSGFNRTSMNKLLQILYRFSFEKAYHILFQNDSDLEKIKLLGVKLTDYSVIPGSGINILDNDYLSYPTNKHKTNFLFIGRIMKEKGIGELALAAEILEKKYNHIKFTVIGFCEEDYKVEFDKILQTNVFNYEGFQDNTDEFIREAHAIILPTYSEGMSNVLLEASIKGRPVLASNIPGCKEIVNDGETGFIFEPKNPDSIVEAIENFLSLSYKDKLEMGLKAREKIKNEFSRELIVQKYLNLTNKKEGQ